MLQRLAWLAALLVLLDLAYSAWQHYHIPLDGDLALIVLPAAHYAQVLRDPLGLSVWRDGASYAATNRYAVHAFMAAYFKHVPLWLQGPLSPIDSVYASAALLKTLLQASILGLLALYASGGGRHFWWAALIMAPLFQTNGYNGIMGLIERAPTYACFYAGPLPFVLLFFWPFFQAHFHGRPPRRPWLAGLGSGALGLVLPFSGPWVAPSLVLLCGPALLWGLLRKNGRRAGPWWWWLPFALALLASAYSFWLGLANSEGLSHQLPLAERYARLPKGLALQFSQKLGPPLLLAWVLGQAWLLRQKGLLSPALRRLLLLSFAFSVLYVLLLPLGGYRDYRPLIVRRDVMLPVFVALLLCASACGLVLLAALRAKWRRGYGLGLAALLMVYGLADGPESWRNACERAALEDLARSPDALVRLPDDCPVLGWEARRDAESSAEAVALLRHWRIAGRAQRFVQPAD